MGDIVIRAERVSKLYRIGPRERYKALRDTLTDLMCAPFRRLRAASQRPAAPPPPGSNGQNTIWALKDVSFDVKQGEIVGIIGRNGAGKSTLLKILSRITIPTEGRARIHGRVGSLLEVGTGFHPELTGRENIYLNGAILGMTRAEIERNFDEIVAFAEVEKFLDTPVKHYSSGMYVRLAFAVAAHLDPEILLVDEVLAVGDATFQKKCLAKIHDVGQQGRTVLFVSHNMPAVTRLCERTILLDAGTILLDGPSPRVVNAYLHSGTGTTAAREWSADTTTPSDSHIVRLSAVRILNEAGDVSDTIDIRESVILEIEYFNRPNDQLPYACIQLYDENGLCIFASGDFNNLDWRHQPRTFSGIVTSRCIIPGNFLSEGLKRVLVAITTINPNTLLAMERDAVSFLVVDRSQGDGVRGDYVGDFPGVVRPLLDWNITYHPVDSR